jgi:hypothetical protein
MSRIVIAAIAVGVVSAPVQSSINYGDKPADDVTYKQVTETALSVDDSAPLFGEPTTSGNTLLFNNMDFVSSVSGELGSDTTIGQLTTTIVADPSIGITGLVFNEVGSVTISGLSNDAYASVAATYVFSVLEVNGEAVDPIVTSVNMVFTPSDGDYQLSVDGVLSSQIWEGSLSVDVDAILFGQDVEGVATKVSLVLTNTLTTASEAGTSAFIGKKQLGGFTVTTIIPSPAGFALLAVGALVGRRRRRR